MIQFLADKKSRKILHHYIGNFTLKFGRYITLIKEAIYFNFFLPCALSEVIKVLEIFIQCFWMTLSIFYILLLAAMIDTGHLFKCIIFKIKVHVKEH